MPAVRAARPGDRPAPGEPAVEQGTEALRVGRCGRTLATLDGPGLVQWSDSGDRSLVTREGPDRTEFRLVDARGIVRSLGSVPGIRLACEAHAGILACSDRAGGLRVWRLPL